MRQRQRCLRTGAQGCATLTHAVALLSLKCASTNVVCTCMFSQRCLDLAARLVSFLVVSKWLDVWMTASAAVSSGLPIRQQLTAPTAAVD
jgi:hypothetical protein